MKRALVLTIVVFAVACGGDDSSNLNYPAFPAPTKKPDAAPLPPVPDGAPAPQQLVINEVSASDDTGGPDDNDFIELFGEPDTDYSTYWVLGIDGNGNDGDTPSGSEGVILFAEQVGSTDGSGFWLTTTGQDVLENNSQTFLLVRNFTGAVSDDVDDDNDGTLNDTVPWSSVFDAVGFDDDSDLEDDLYLTIGGVTYGPGITKTPGTPGGASRIPDGHDTNTLADWVESPESGVAADDTEANRTPGASNTLGDPPA